MHRLYLAARQVVERSRPVEGFDLGEAADRTPSTKTYGTVVRPVKRASRERRASSWVVSTTSYAYPLCQRRRFARQQERHRSRV